MGSCQDSKGRVAMCRCATTLLSDVDPAEAAAELLEGKGATTNRSDSHKENYNGFYIWWWKVEEEGEVTGEEDSFLIFFVDDDDEEDDDD